MNYQITIIIPFNSNELAYLAEDALKSILFQPKINNCKIVVSNNGSFKVGRKIFRSKIYKNKISYIETPKFLNIIDHFNWLIRIVKTKYFMILPARRMLKFGALKEFINVMDSNPSCQICCSSYCHWEEDLKCLISHKVGGKHGLLSTKMIIRKFIKGDYSSRQEFWSYFPTTLNGIVRTDFVNKLRKLYSKDFYEKLSPDVTAAFKCLLNASKIYRIRKSQFQISNRSISHSFQGSKTDLAYIKNMNYNFSFIPEQLKISIYCGIFEDFARQSSFYYNHKKKNIINCKLNKFILQQAAIEIIFKTFRDIPSKETLCNFFLGIKYLFKLNLSFLSFIKSIFFSISYLLYYFSPIPIKKILLKVRGNYIYYDNKYEAANFLNKKI